MSNAEKISKAFIEYLKEEEAYHLLPEITEELQAEVFRNQDISVITAVEATEKEKTDLKKDLLAKWGEHRVVFTVDETLLSGLIVRFQDNIIDLSGRQGLRELKENLNSSL